MSIKYSLWSALQPLSVSVAVGVLLLVVAGVGDRILTQHLVGTSRSTTLVPGTLERMPMHIGSWDGRSEPIDESILRAADVDDYVNRVYVRSGLNQAVGVWIAFGVRARDLMPHRPEVCYPGAGWTLHSRDATTVGLEDGNELRTRVLTFSRGGLESGELTVLNYYVVDGETCEDVSLLRSRAWRGQNSIRYMAQVQITCRGNRVDRLVAEAAVREFAASSFSSILGVLTETAPADVPTASR